jgi:hypothetical protein
MAEPTLEEARLPSPEECWALIERVAGSAELKRAQRLRDILLYVSRRSLKEGSSQISEQEIGSAVFDRPAGYDTSVDTIVRVSTSELRKRIKNYFEGEGQAETLAMEIPRGSYVPVFSLRGAAPSGDEQQPNPVERRWLLPAFLATATIALLFAVACGVLWLQIHHLQRSLFTWKYQPWVAAFWSDFLGASQRTDIVLPDITFSLIQHASNRAYSFDEYLNRTYLAEAQHLSPQQQTMLSLFDMRNLGDPGAFRLTLRFQALDPFGRSIHIYNARDYLPDLVMLDNVILLGGRTANPWDDLFESRMNFTAVTTFDFGTADHSFTAIVNHQPKAGEQSSYRRSGDYGYCVIAFLPNPNGDGRALLIEGTNDEAIEAGGDFLLSEERMSNFKKLLQMPKFPYFEILLKVSSVKGTPLTGMIETYRVYPKLK